MPPNEVIEKILKEIEPKLNEISTRKVLSDLLGGMVAHRTWANLDSLNKGVGVKIRIGRTVGYPKQAVIEWLKKNLTVECND